jgi:hypothetical protein
VLSRYKGDVKIGSLPYTLNVNANGDPTTMNMGSRVPVASTTFAPQANGQPPATMQSYTYQNIGTSIELRASQPVDNLFELQLSVDDSSVATVEAGRGGQGEPVPPTAPNLPVFRSFKGRNTLLLKDGQSRQYTVATDRISGEVLKVDVTLKVLKN